MIKTKIWSSDWFSELSVDAKLLYVYLLSNLNTHICGYYKLSLKEIEFFTGLTKKKILAALKLLDENIQYIDGWVVIKNYPKYQNVTNNVKVQAAIERALEQIPAHVLNLNHKSKSKSESIDSLSIPSKKEKKVDKPVDNEKKAYGEFRHVMITDEEKQKLKEKYSYSVAKKLMNDLDTYIESTGKDKYKSHYATMLTWARRAGIETQRAPTKTEPDVEISEEQKKKNLAALEKMKKSMADKFKMSHE